MEKTSKAENAITNRENLLKLSAENTTKSKTFERDLRKKINEKKKKMKNLSKKAAIVESRGYKCQWTDDHVKELSQNIDSNYKFDQKKANKFLLTFLSNLNPDMRVCYAGVENQNVNVETLDVNNLWLREGWKVGFGVWKAQTRIQLFLTSPLF